MSENQSSRINRHSRSQSFRHIGRFNMPIQLNNPSQVSSNIVRMVSNIIPQIEQQISAQMNEPEMGDTSEMTLPGHLANPQLPPNPYLPHGRRQGHSLGHSRSHSYTPMAHFRHQNVAPQMYQTAVNPHDVNVLQGQQSVTSQQLPFHPSQEHGHAMNVGAQNLHSEPSQQGADNVSTSDTQSNMGDNQNFVVDFGTNGDVGGGNIPPEIGDATPPNIDDTNNNGRQPTNANNPLSNMRTIWKATQGIPFLVILFAKILYDHRLGILCLIGLFGTYYHANSSLKRQISQRDSHGVFDALGNLCWIIVFLALNIIFIYYVFDDEKLYRTLYFQTPEVSRMDIWTLFWIVGVTDFVIKYATIMIKACIALLPKPVLSIKKKGKHYMLVEVISQFYRSLMPVLPWLLYLHDTQHGGQGFAYLLCGLYVIFKAHHVWTKVRDLRKAFSAFRLDVSYGSVPRREELQKVDNCCPICQDKLSEPVKLSCSHIFCEDCVSMWFDREKTCPMCRAQIVDNPMWRDGTTSASLDMY